MGPQMPMQCLVVPVLFRRCYVWHAMNWCRLQSLKIIYSVLQQTLHHKTSFPEHFSRKCRYTITAASSHGGLSIFARVNDLVATHGADSLLVGALLAVVRVHLVHLKKKSVWRLNRCFTFCLQILHFLKSESTGLKRFFLDVSSLFSPTCTEAMITKS